MWLPARLVQSRSCDRPPRVPGTRGVRLDPHRVRRKRRGWGARSPSLDWGYPWTRRPPRPDASRTGGRARVTARGVSFQASASVSRWDRNRRSGARGGAIARFPSRPGRRGVATRLSAAACRWRPPGSPRHSSRRRAVPGGCNVLPLSEGVKVPHRGAQNGPSSAGPRSREVQGKRSSRRDTRRGGSYTEWRALGRNPVAPMGGSSSAQRL